MDNANEKTGDDVVNASSREKGDDDESTGWKDVAERALDMLNARKETQDESSEESACEEDVGFWISLLLLNLNSFNFILNKLIENKLLNWITTPQVSSNPIDPVQVSHILKSAHFCKTIENGDKVLLLPSRKQ